MPGGPLVGEQERKSASHPLGSPAACCFGICCTALAKPFVPLRTCSSDPKDALVVVVGPMGPNARIGWMPSSSWNAGNSAWGLGLLRFGCQISAAAESAEGSRRVRKRTVSTTKQQHTVVPATWSRQVSHSLTRLGGSHRGSLPCLPTCAIPAEAHQGFACLLSCGFVGGFVSL